MGPDDEFEDDFGDEGDPLGFDPEEEHSQSGHSESVFVVDDEEAGRESFLERASQAFDAMAERAAFAEDLAEAAFVDADPTARDAASNLGIEPAVEAPPVVDEAARKHLRGLLEALLFVAERPMKAADLAEVARADLKEVRSLLEAMSEEYREEQRGFQLDELAGGFQIRTSAAYAPFVRELTNAKPVRLSRAQVETLAIIAYRQPITRPEVDDIRGVDAGAVIKLLLDRDLIRILGKKDEPGRPLLYGTTAQFLSFFGLKSLKDLPTLREFTELTEESREVVERELGEVLPDGPHEPIPSAVTDSRADTTEQPVVEEAPSERAETVENAIPDEIVNELAEQPEEPVESESEEEPSSDTQREPELEARADNDTEVDDEPSTETDYKPGGASYDPSDEDEFPDDDDTDDEDDEDEDEEDDEEDEDDEDE